MQELLTVLIVWLSVNYGLPVSDELPDVRRVDAETMIDARLARLASTEGAARGSVTDASAMGSVRAFYDDSERTIYLPERWTVASPAESSVLVHELVHHLQNVGGERHACPEEREGLAYEAQARWLELLGTNLEEAFGIDAMTRLVRTTCVH